jgi:hypothetical protein
MRQLAVVGQIAAVMPEQPQHTSHADDGEQEKGTEEEDKKPEHDLKGS